VFITVLTIAPLASGHSTFQPDDHTHLIPSRKSQLVSFLEFFQSKIVVCISRPVRAACSAYVILRRHLCNIWWRVQTLTVLNFTHSCQVSHFGPNTVVRLMLQTAQYLIMLNALFLKLFCWFNCMFVSCSRWVFEPRIGRCVLFVLVVAGEFTLCL
jgi:hypothetical protein